MNCFPKATNPLHKIGLKNPATPELSDLDAKLLKKLIRGKKKFALCAAEGSQKVLYASPSLCSLLKYAWGEMEASDTELLDLVNTNDDEFVPVKKAMELKHEICVCLHNTKWDGAPFHNQFFLTTLKDTDGKHCYFLGVVRELVEFGPGQGLLNPAYAFRATQRGSSLAAFLDPDAQLREHDRHLLDELNTQNQMFVLCNPHLKDTPIVHVTDSFCDFTGYDRNEIECNNCRFLQGKSADDQKEKRNQILDAIKNSTDLSVCLQNYKKNGTPFANQFFLTPLKSHKGETMFFLGVQQRVKVVKPGQDKVNMAFVLSGASKGATQER